MLGVEVRVGKKKIKVFRQGVKDSSDPTDVSINN
jgi:hypothetical protein